MKIVWLLNHYAAEPTGSGGTRHYGLARHAERLGYRVIIIAASVEHLTGRQRLESGETARLEEIGGVSFLWLKTSEYSGNGTDRIRDMMEYFWRALRRSTTACLPAPDFIIGSSVHPLAALAAERLAARHEVPFLFEIRDLWPETLIQMGRLRSESIMAVILRRLESWLCLKARKVIVLLPRAHDYLVHYGVPEDKVVWIPNGADPELFAYRPPATQEGLTVMYLGAHGAANGLVPIVEAISDYARRSGTGRVRFRFVGDGPEKPHLRALAGQLGVEKLISFEPSVSKQQLPEVAAQADAFILNMRNLDLYRYGFSFNKLFDYMAAGRPVIFAAPSDDNPIAEANAGIITATGRRSRAFVGDSHDC